MDGVELDRRRWPERAELSRWKAADGLELRRMDWPPDRAAPARGSLFFAGGRADFLEKYLEAYGYWNHRGWHVTSFDWRGQGLSRSAMPGVPATFERLVLDLADLLGEWTKATPAPHVAVAHSMGGHLLLRTLAEARPPLAAVVLIAPMLEINSAPIPPRAARLVTRLACRVGLGGSPLWRTGPDDDRAGARRREYLTGSADHYDDELWWKRETPSVELGPPDWAWLRAAYRSCDALWKAPLEAVNLPVLLLGTETDRLVDSRAIRRIAAKLPRAETFMYADAGHELLRDRAEIRFDAMARIDRFFEAHAQ